LKEIEKIFTAPSADEGWSPTYEYSLRGVIVEQNSMYIRMREKGDLMETDPPAPVKEQWVKVSYNSDHNVVVEVSPLEYGSSVEISS